MWNCQSGKSKYETLKLDVKSYFYVSLVTTLLTLCLDKSTDIATCWYWICGNFRLLLCYDLQWFFSMQWNRENHYPFLLNFIQHPDSEDLHLVIVEKENHDVDVTKSICQQYAVSWEIRISWNSVQLTYLSMNKKLAY